MNLAITLPLARLWRQHPRETLVLGTLGLAALGAIAGSAYSTPTPLNSPAAALANGEAAPPQPPPLLVRELPAEDALSLNAAIPMSSGPNPAARPFILAGVDAASKARALDCLTSAIYYEAGNESAEGQKAVAQVVLNRVRHPAFPANVCGVVYEGSTRATGCQFTFTCDGSLARRPTESGWARARKVAEAALNGAVYAPAGHATHYHANYVVPYWASSLAKNAVVGTHIFYLWAGGWGRPAAFSMRYAGREPDSGLLRTAALTAGAEHAATDTATAEAAAAEAIPGATVIPGEGRVGVRFNLAARKAVEEAPRRDYVEKFKVTDNLRWSLSKEIVEADAKPLGKADPVLPPAPAGSGTGALK